MKVKRVYLHYVPRRQLCKNYSQNSFPLSETKFEIDKLNSKVREATKNKSPTLTANQFGVASTLLAN